MNAQRALNSYGSVKVVAGVATANNVELIMMLFDGLIESLSLARGHIQHGSIELKSRTLQRASRIVLGLQNALDHERGGELARNLSDLYTYVVRRIIDINAYNDLQALDEIASMMTEIRGAWQQVPSLVPAPAMPQPMVS